LQEASAGYLSPKSNRGGIPVLLATKEPCLMKTAACVPEAARMIAFDRAHATRYVNKEAAASLSLDLVRDNRMPGRGRSA
jgi:hypothetical protein